MADFVAQLVMDPFWGGLIICWAIVALFALGFLWLARRWPY